MNTLFEELGGGLPDWLQFERVVIRLLAAMLLGAIVGLERERKGKAAGLRTHMLVAMGSALFVLAGAAAGMSMSDLSRVIQGLATGIGFIGAGAILKLHEAREIEGLTTAAGILDDGCRWRGCWAGPDRTGVFERCPDLAGSRGGGLSRRANREGARTFCRGREAFSRAMRTGLMTG